MKIKLKKYEAKEIEVDVEFPIYFKVNMMLDDADSYVFGKITEDYLYTIRYEKYFRSEEVSYEVCKSKIKNLTFNGVADYLLPNNFNVFHINESEFLAVKEKTLKFISEV